MKKSFIVAAVCLLPTLLFAQQSKASLQAEVIVKTASLSSALVAKDSVGLSKLLADEVTYGHTNGLIQTKAELVRSVMSGEQDYKSIEPGDMRVRIYENTGVVTMKTKVAMLYNRNPLDLSMFVTLVWIRNGSNWKLVARQSVKLQ